jgi:hypothetical protein
MKLMSYIPGFEFLVGLYCFNELKGLSQRSYMIFLLQGVTAGIGIFIILLRIPDTMLRNRCRCIRRNISSVWQFNPMLDIHARSFVVDSS